MTQATISFDPPHNGTDTSRAAAESMKPHTGRLCVLIIDELSRRQFSGATCDELESVMGLSHQTVSARLRELAHPKVRKIYHHGKRTTRSGRQARVYFLTSTARK